MRGTLQADTLGGSFRILAHDFTVNGGKLRSLGDTDDRGGVVSVELTGVFEMNGTGSRMETSGNGGGGDIYVKAAGINLLTGVVAADGGTGEYCGPAGAVSFVATAAPSTVQNSVRAVTGGSDCEGGEIEFIGPAVTVSGDLDAHGGASASPFAIYVVATSGDLVVTASASMNANGIGQPDGLGADGGEIVLDAEVGSLVMNAAVLSATGKSPQGFGGSVFLSAGGDVDVNSTALVYGGSDGAGGTFQADARADLTVSGDIDATGGETVDFSYGGDIELFADGSLSIDATLNNSSVDGGDTLISAASLSTTTGSSILSRGSRGQGGTVAILACDMTLRGSIDTGGVLGGTAGAIELTGREITLTSTSEATALPCTRATCIGLGTAGAEPSIDPLSSIAPTPSFSTLPAIPSCPP